MNRKFYPFILFFCLSLFTLSHAAAQNFLSKKRGVSKVPERGVTIVVGGGVAGVKSDICGSPGCNDLGPNVSVGALYKMTPYLGASGQIDYVRVGASEKDPRQPLNISFQSEIIQVSGTVVLNLLDSYAGVAGYRSLRKRFVVPYARAGAGFVYYTPTSYPGTGDLNDSQTTYDPERKYPAVAVVIPFGGGLRFRINDEFSISPELMYHITTTDNLDNIGPRLGNPGNKDHFGVASVKLMYTPALQNKIFSRKYSRK
jgi:hypothetical protein